MAKIFISYRRRLDGFLVLNLSEKLRNRFGEDSVFLDIDNIPLGVDFVKHIGNEVGRCDVLLAIISEQWAGVTDKQGNKRLEQDGDYVRIEIESALKRDIPVIPVLVDEALMPPAADLPASIQSIVNRNATKVRADSEFHQYIERLIRGLEAHFELREKPESETVEEVQKTKPPEKKKEKPEPKEEKETAAPPAIEAVNPEEEELARKHVSLDVIVKILDGLTDSHLYLAGHIPGIKLNAAISAYAPGVAPEDVLLLYDNTFWGSAKDGLLLTADAVYWRNNWNETDMAPFSNIANVTYQDHLGSSVIGLDGHLINIAMGDDRVKLTKALADAIHTMSLFVREYFGIEPAVPDDNLPFELMVPGGWVRQPGEPTTELFVGDPIEELLVLAAREPRSVFSPSTTLEDYVNLTQNHLHTFDVKEVQFSQVISATVGGFRAFRYEASGIPDSGIRIIYLFYCLETPENFYKIMSTTRADKYSENESKLWQIMDSFREK